MQNSLCSSWAETNMFNIFNYIIFPMFPVSRLFPLSGPLGWTSRSCSFSPRLVRGLMLTWLPGKASQTSARSATSSCGSWRITGAATPCLKQTWLAFTSTPWPTTSWRRWMDTGGTRWRQWWLARVWRPVRPVALGLLTPTKWSSKLL